MLDLDRIKTDLDRIDRKLEQCENEEVDSHTLAASLGTLQGNCGALLRAATEWRRERDEALEELKLLREIARVTDLLSDEVLEQWSKDAGEDDWSGMVDWARTLRQLLAHRPA